MRILKHLTTWLLLLPLFLASGVVSGKVASGPQNPGWTGHQAETTSNPLWHQAKIDYSYGGASGSPVVTKNGASSAKQAANLKEHLRQADKYGQGGVKELQNGKNRYYGNVSPANKPGEMVGRRTVREWNPATGNKRTWHETVDHNGNVRIVRPQRSDNAKTHYQFDANGNYTGKF